ncbi:MAG: cohesin domain-containing protein [Candidatus Marinimicrobia bacterium]|nr:cohesin domain-containing protein [Candidatus Neomarinimicrobiota bacterium]
MIRNRIMVFMAALLIIGMPLPGFSQINVSLPANLSGEVGATAIVPITVDDLTGQNASSFEFTITFDKNIVKVTDFDASGTISDGMSIVVNTNTDGQIRVAAAKATALSGSGVLGKLTVEFQGAGEDDLVWTKFMFNEGVPASVATGCHVVVGAVDVGISNVQGDISDAVVMPITVDDLTGKNVTSYEFTLTYDESVMNITGVDAVGTLSAGMNIVPNDGVGQLTVAAAGVEALSGSGVLLNLNIELIGNGVCDVAFSNFMFNEGAPAAKTGTAKAYVGQVDVTLPTVTGHKGETNFYPILVEDVTGLDVMAYEFTFIYDQTKINVIGVKHEATLSAGFNVVPNTTVDGQITVAAAGTEALVGADTLLLLEVVLLETGVSDLTWSSFTFNEGTPSSKLINGAITVVPILGVDLLFSEYIEGSSNNKALELFNGSDAAVNLDDYRIAQSVNGGGWQYYHYFPQGAALNAGDVWVILNDGTSSDYYLAANADEVLPYPSVVHHNGDDARGIEKRFIYGTDTTWVLIDVIGIPDEDPGNGWNLAGVTEATKDHTLIRKATVTMGNIDWIASAGTDEASSEWVVMPQNTFGFLGSHPHDDFVGPEIAGVVAISETALQVRFSEEVDPVAAADVANYSIDGGIGNPASVEMVKNNIAVLTIAGILPNTAYILTVNGVKDLAGNVIAANSVADFGLVQPGELPIDIVSADFETGMGTWQVPTYSGSTSGILTTSTFGLSDEAVFDGTKSAKMNLLDDPAKSGWFVRVWNSGRPDVAIDSKLFTYIKASNPNIQVRFVFRDDGAGGDNEYLASPWVDITYTEDDWQVIGLDLTSTPLISWAVVGNGAISSTNVISIDCIQLQCKDDVDAVLYFDKLTERPNISPVEVTFEVDMSVQTILGNFNIASDIVDVAGSFNGWGGNVMVMDDADGDTIYSITVLDLYPGESLEYKFRINSNWDTSEFPGGGPNRVYVVPAENSVVRHWYDDKDRSYLGIEDVGALPKEFALHQNYPNPFNPITTIKYELPKESLVKIIVFDLMGKEVRTLVSQKQNAGYQTVIWDALDNYGRRVSSGYYIYMMQAESFHKTQKMILLK